MRTVRIPDDDGDGFVEGLFHAITVRDGKPMLVVEVVRDKGIVGRFVLCEPGDVNFCYRQTEPLPGDERQVDPLIIAAQRAAARAATPLRIPPAGRGIGHG